MTRTKTARLIPDAVYPGMCRVRWPDGRVSDMVNLTRANDAIACYGETVERQRRGRHSHRNGRQGIFSMAFWPKQNSSRLRRSIVTAITSATQATTPFGTQTYQVRVSSTLPVWLTIGSTGAAANVDSFLPANAPEYFSVTPGAVLSFNSTSTSSGYFSTTEMS